MIEIPFKRVVWNEHEAALLVDTFEKVRKGIVSRDKAIVELSKRLRSRMILDGIAINEKYRNVSGMDLQLLSLERSVDNNGETSLKTIIYLKHSVQFINLAKTKEKLMIQSYLKLYYCIQMSVMKR